MLGGEFIKGPGIKYASMHLQKAEFFSFSCLTRMAAKKPPKTSPAGPPTTGETLPAVAGEGTESGGVKKTTVSFHSSEQSQVDEILDALFRTRRHRGGFSDAIKIALRLCPLDDETIAKAWDEARAQDGRVLRHRKNS